MNRFQARREARRRWGKRGHAERRRGQAVVGWHVGDTVRFLHVTGVGDSFAEAFEEVDRRDRRDERYAQAMRDGGRCERCQRALTRANQDRRSSAAWIVGDVDDELVCIECKNRDRFGEHLAHLAAQYVLALRCAGRSDTDPQLRKHQLLRAGELWERLDGSDRGRCVRVLHRLGLRVHDHEVWEAERVRQQR